MSLRLHLHRLRAPLAEPAANATGRWRMRSGLLLVLRDGAGGFGLGEASPLPRFSPDSAEEVAARLQGFEPAEPPKGDPAAVRRFVREVLEALPASLPAARFGVETALLDLAARARGIPFASMLSDRPPREVAAAALLVAEEDDALVVAAVEAVEAGATTLKIKLGLRASLAAELRGLRRVRAEVGPRVALRLDLNRSLSAGAVPIWLAALAEIDPEWVEEPGAGPADWPEASPVRLSADESLLDTPGFADDPRASCLALKPTVLGGCLRALDLAERASARGAGAYASHTYEGTVGTAAVAALATVLPGGAAAGVTAQPGLALGPHDGLPLLGGYRVRVAEGPGLGLSLPEDA